MTVFPDWVTFDPDAVPDPSELADVGQVVAIVATERAHKAGWSTWVAVEAAGAWSREGRRVVLADGAFAEPKLHQELGIDDGEGLSDVLGFGLSVGRVTHRIPAQRFLAIAAGTVVADPEEAMAGDGWPRLCQGFRDAGVTLAVYLDAGDPGTGVALREVSQVLVVAAPGEPVPPIVADSGCTVVGLVGVPRGDGDAQPSEDAETPEAEAAPRPTEVGAVPGDHAAAVPPQADAEPAYGGDGPSETEEVAVEAAPTDPAGAPAAPAPGDVTPSAGGAARKAKRGGPSPLILGLGVVAVVAAVLGAAFFGLLNIPGITPADEPAAEEPATDSPVAAASVAAGPPAATSTVQSYSIAMGAFTDPDAAAGMVASLQRRVPDVLFMVVPVTVDGRPYYRALAGPAADSSDAEELLVRLAQFTGSSAANWVLRSTPRAFQLGETADLEAAERRAEVLHGLDIPAYVLAVDYDDGSTRYRVYAGAYADEDEASLLLVHLTDRGLNAAQLADRKGRLPA